MRQEDESLIKDPKKTVSIGTSIIWLILVVWTFLKNKEFIIIESPWLVENEPLLGLFILSWPSVWVLIKLAINDKGKTYNKRFFAFTELTFMLAYLLIVLLLHCDFVISIIFWLVISIPFVICHIRY